MEQLLASVCAGLSQKHSVSVLTAFAENNFTTGREMVFRPSAPGMMRYFLFAFTKGIALLYANPGIRIIFGGSVLVTPIVLLLARLFRRKAIVQAHGLDLIYRNSIYQCAIVRCLRYVDRVIVNSHHTAKLAQEKSVADSAIEVIPPGVDWQRFQVAASAEALKQSRGFANRKVILFVGRLAPRKGVREFIEHSLIDIAKQVPEVCFVIAGDNPTESLTHHDDMASEIRHAIANQKLADHVQLLGTVSDNGLVQLYALCDVVVLPVLDLTSDVEGFGMVALEAAAAGKPVVATRCGGISDAVQDGVTGVLVEPGNYAALSCALVRLLHDTPECGAMGEAGRKIALSEFGWARIVARYENVLAENIG